MPRCSYCKNEYSVPRGLSLVLNDGTVKHLCSSKCRKNMQMKRRKTRWISKAHKSKAELKAEIMAEAEEKSASNVEVSEKKE